MVNKKQGKEMNTRSWYYEYTTMGNNYSFDSWRRRLRILRTSSL